MSSPLYSNQPDDVVRSFLELKKTVEDLERHTTEAGQVPGYFRREFAVAGLPQADSSFSDVPKLSCVEYWTHGTVSDDLPRQVRYGYRPNNGYSESVSYRDKFWTAEGEVSYTLEISALKSGTLKRCESYIKNGETVRSEVTHVNLRRGQRF